MNDVQGYGKQLYLVALVPPIVAILTILIAPDPHGHWSEHLWGAYLGATQLLLLTVLVAMIGVPVWRSIPRVASALLLLSIAVIAVGVAYEVAGDYQVAGSIWRTSGNPGFGDGYNEGHDRAATGDLVVIAGGAAFAFVAGLARLVPVKIALLALLMVVIPPPFVWPAAGVLMLLLYGLTSTQTFDRQPVVAA